MSDPITLPGTIPGLLRECSPVVLLAAWQGIPAGKQGVATEILTDKVTPRVDLACEGMLESCRVRDLSLRLDHETGRHHACRWLAMFAHDVPEKDACRAYWARSRYGGEDGVYWSLNFPSLSTDCPGTERTNNIRLYAAVAGFFQREVLDCLAALNLGDPTLLPDGSRRLDALALQAVCLHVGGGR